jgi:2-C-methyl-D-erythritol 4-phosphate cytidylyltransferase
MARYFALVPAAGAGARFGGATPKQYLQANGRPLLWHALACLSAHPAIERVFVILQPGDVLYAEHPWGELSERIVPLRVGGDVRAQTVLNGLRALREQVADEDWLLVHDAVRPCLQPEWIDRLIGEAGNDDVGGLLAVPLSDTLKQADTSARVASTQPRAGLWRAQTPQMFRYGLLVRALVQADAAHTTDEASAVERLGLAPRLVMGSDLNIKVTYPEDLRLTQLILNNIRALGA